MMDERRNVFGLGGSQPNSNFKQLSPYLNVDPSLLQTQAPEFIMDQEMTRGKLENSFTAIGTGLFVGAAAGGFYGFFDGIRHASASNMAGKLRKTAIINHTLKSGKNNHRFHYTYPYGPLFLDRRVLNQITSHYLLWVWPTVGLPLHYFDTVNFRFKEVFGNSKKLS